SDTRALLHRPWIRTRLRPPAFLPFERLSAAPDALFETVVRVRKLIVVLARHVLHDEVHGVHLHSVRHVVHHRLDTVQPLRILGTGEIPGNGLVGVHGIDHGFDMRALINVDAVNRSGIFPVTSHTAVAAKLDRLERTLARYANLVVLNGGPSAVNADEI